MRKSKHSGTGRVQELLREYLEDYAGNPLLLLIPISPPLRGALERVRTNSANWEDCYNLLDFLERSGIITDGESEEARAHLR